LKVHERSIKILEEVGVKFLSEKALKIMEKNGARVDKKEKLAKIPREVPYMIEGMAAILGSEDKVINVYNV